MKLTISFKRRKISALEQNVMHKNMKNILKGIVLGSIVTPLATIAYQAVAWFVYGFGESNLKFIDMLIYGSGIGLFGIIVAIVALLSYGLPLFLLLRRFSLANWVAVIIFAVLPWVIIDGFINKDIHHFIEFSWYSIASGMTFWFFAQQSPNLKAENA